MAALGLTVGQRVFVNARDVRVFVDEGAGAAK
jgi:hypothetical protein